MKLIIHFLVFVFLLTPVISSAQETQGLVPQCEGSKCSTGDFVKLIDNVIKFLVTMLSVIAVIVMVYAGFLMVTSGGDENKWTTAKGLFTNVVIGIILVLAAWLIVDTLLSMLTGDGLESITTELAK